jgi:hypothetical protein
MAKEYRFDEANHIHSIGGVTVPGITTCIKPLYDFSAVPEHIMKASCEYGSAVHKVVELYCLDALDVETLDVSLVPSLRGFEQWITDYKLNRSDFIVEVPMGDATLMYGGIPDIILDGQLIVELKTRKVNMLTDSIQTTAQEALWKKNGGIRTKEYERRVLELKQDGTYTYTKVNDKQGWPRFRKLLDHYHDAKSIQTWRK